MPPRIDPADARINFHLYVIKQLHEPLFSSSVNGKPQSRILARWNASPDLREFSFCLKPDLRYASGKPVTVEALWENFARFDEHHELAHDIVGHRTSDGCLTVSFDAPYPRLTWDLMSYTTAVADPATRGAKVVEGISPYRVVEMNSRVIRLHADGGVRYRDLSFHAWRPGDETPISSFDDINMVVSNDVPPDVDETMNRYDVVMLKTYGVLINSADPLLRSYLFNCLEIDVLRAMIDRKKRSFTDVGGVLPVGMPGAIAGRVTQACPVQPLPRRVKATMVTFNEDCAGQMQAYLTRRLAPLGIDATVKAVDSNGMAAILWSGEKAYDMAIVGIDAPLPDPVSFFANFMPGEGGATTVRNATLERIVRDLGDVTPDALREDQMRQANRALLENHQVLPLFQVDVPLYFSKRIPHISADQLLVGMPRIAEL